MAAAGTAYAAIPNANGVINGCYNVLTGSARIVDGTSCGFLERSISWSQTGPQGPAGEQGPEGPQGPAGLSNVLVGSGSLTLDLETSPTEVYGYIENQTIVAPSDGKCSITVSATMLEASGEAIFGIATFNSAGTTNTYAQTAYLRRWDDPGSGSNVKYKSGATLMDIATLHAGESYSFGIRLAPQTQVSEQKPVFVSLSWVCTFDS